MSATGSVARTIRPAVTTPRLSLKGLPFGVTLSAIFAVLIGLIPIIGKLAAIPILVILVPLVLWTAFTNTERALYLYIGWCWFDGSIRGVLGDNSAAIIARDIVMGIITMGWLLQRRVITPHDPIKIPPMTILIVLFVIDCLLQIFNPYNLGLFASIGGLKAHLSAIPLFFIGYDVFRRKEQVRNLALYITLISVIISLVFCVQYVHGRTWTYAHFPGTDKIILSDIQLNADHSDDQSNMDVRNYRPPGCGTMGGITGFFDAFAFPLAFALLLSLIERKGSMLARGAIIGLFLLFTVVIFLSAMRVALFHAIFACAACAWFCGGRFRIRALLVLFLCLIIGLASWNISSNASGGAVSHRWGSTFTDPIKTAHSDRQTFFEQLPVLIEHSPFGVGLGRTGAVSAYDNGKSENLGFVAYSESYYGLLILETGIPGALLLSILIFKLPLDSMKKVSKIAFGEDRFIAAALLGSLIIIVFECFTVNELTQPPGTIFFWLFGAILLRAYLPSRKTVGPVAVEVEDIVYAPAPALPESKR